MHFKTFDHGVNIVSLKKNNQFFAMTCAWSTQIDDDKVMCLIGEQSVTNSQIEINDIIAISVLNIEQKDLSLLIGDTHSNEFNKLIDTIEIMDVVGYKNSNRILKCQVIELIKINQECNDLAVVAKIIQSEELNNKPFLHMSDIR